MQTKKVELEKCILERQNILILSELILTNCIPQLSMSGILTLTHPGHIRGSRNYYVFWIVSSSVGSALVRLSLPSTVLLYRSSCAVSVCFLFSQLFARIGPQPMNKKVTCTTKFKKYTYIPLLEVQVKEVEGKEKFNMSFQLSL